MKQRVLSTRLYTDSCRLIPGGVNSPVRAFPGLNMTPIMATQGKGSKVWDVDGNEYIDFCGSWGALILGHAFPSVVQEAIMQVERGSTFGMATPYEYELAQEILTHIPSIEKIRFVSSGTEAVMSALRLARGFTGRDTIVKFDGNYHGHSDGLLVSAGSGVSLINTSSSKGIPDDLVRHTVSLPYNDIEICQKFIRSHDNIAAVVLEPIAGNMGVIPPLSEFLVMLREETRKKGIVLIFDEVITGFRVGLGGAQALYQIEPDLTCLGKIIGGGFPAAAFGGKEEIMNHLAPLGEVYQAGTLSGCPVAMRAGLATLKEVAKPGFYEELDRNTRILTDPLEAVLTDHEVCINRVGSMFTLFLGHRTVNRKTQLDIDLYAQLFTDLFNQGIYIPPSPYEAWFVSAAHAVKELESVFEIIITSLSKIFEHAL